MVTALVSGSLRYLFNREMGALKGNGRSLFSQGTFLDREDVQTPMSQLLILMEFGKVCMLDHSQTAELCFTEIPHACFWSWGFQYQGARLTPLPFV